jgi:hypothetical protein
LFTFRPSKKLQKNKSLKTKNKPLMNQQSTFSLSHKRGTKIQQKQVWKPITASDSYHDKNLMDISKLSIDNLEWIGESRINLRIYPSYQQG